MPTDATFTAYVNAGFGVVPPSKDTTFLVEENTGWVMPMPSSPNAAFLVQENVGFPLPPQRDVDKPQTAWGMALVPTVTVSLQPLSANATFSAYEGDVTT